MLNVNRIINNCNQILNDPLQQTSLDRVNSAIGDLKACLGQIQPVGAAKSNPQIKVLLNDSLSRIELLKARILHPKADCFFALAQKFLGPAFNQAYLQHSFYELVELGDFYEDCTERFLAFASETKIDITQLEPLNENQRKMLGDIFVLVCLQPTQKVSHDPPKINQIAPFNFLDVAFLLKSRVHLERFTKQIDMENYPKYSISQKIFAFNSAKVDLKQAQPLYKTPLYQSVLKHVNLNRLLFQNMSSAHTQVYLNTCAAASVNQELLLKINSIPALLGIAHKIQAEVQAKVDKLTPKEADEMIFKNALGLGGVKRKAHLEKQLKKVDKLLKEAEEHIHALLNSGKPLTSANLEHFFNRWNRATQILASIYDPHKITYLSKKPIQENWLVSLLLMLLPGIFMGLFGNYPLAERRHGVETQHVSELEKLSTYPNPWRLELSHTQFDKHLSQAGVEKLWETFFAQGGSGLHLGSHRVFVRAITLEGEKRFVLFEPKGIKSYIYNFEDFQKFLKKHASNK